VEKGSEGRTVKTAGTIESVTRNASGRYTVTLDTDSRAIAIADALRGKRLDIIIKPHREKRSLDQNALYWSIVVQLAAALKQSNIWVHNTLISRYGSPFIVNGGLVSVMIPADDPTVMESEEYHLSPSSEVAEIDGQVMRRYIVMRGSSTYSKREMQRLIDGAESEARDMGVHLEIGID